VRIAGLGLQQRGGRDRRRLAGVLDWEIALIGDPARDIAGLGYLGRSFVDAVFAEYAERTANGDPALRVRAEWVFAVRGFYGLRHALENRDTAELEASIAKLRRGPVLA
jgi:aminoglycoside phosphotransferase (APT) family kinase protein